MNKIFKFLLILAITLTAYNWLHDYATVFRGVEAVGGEIVVFAVPFLVYGIKETIKDLKVIKRGSKNEKQKTV